jgi:purine-binding chemotaxis protein CheW
MTPTNVQQYVSFKLGPEYYGAGIHLIHELKGWDTVTRIPYTPKYLLGVLNLRGAIVPVIDLRIRFGLDRVPYDPSTVIVVVRVPTERGERTAGVVVDAVSEVLHVPAADVKPAAPVLTGAVEQSFINGIAQVGERLVMLLDIGMLVNASIAAA